MEKPLNSINLHQSVASLVNEDLFEFAQTARTKYGTGDLVVLLDMTEAQPELSAIRRLEMATSSQLPASVRSKIGIPASEVQKTLQKPHESFWFFATLSSGEMVCVAVNASMLAQGGTA
jgi:hypothetical protein